MPQGMSKAIKFKNNMYLDTRGAVHNGAILKTYLDNLENSKQNIITNLINRIIDSSGSNYIKFTDGTMVCWGSKNYTLTNNDAQIGGLWYTTRITDLGTFAQTFKQVPIVITGCIKGAFNVAEYNCNSTTNVGYCWFTNGTKRTNESITFVYIAIGKWK